MKPGTQAVDSQGKRNGMDAKYGAVIRDQSKCHTARSLGNCSLLGYDREAEVGGYQDLSLLTPNIYLYE